MPKGFGAFQEKNSGASFGEKLKRPGATARYLQSDVRTMGAELTDCGASHQIACGVAFMSVSKESQQRPWRGLVYSSQTLVW